MILSKYTRFRSEERTKMTSRQKLLMISFDAVGDQDVDALLHMQNFRKLCQSGTLVRKVSSIFISNTYPTHTTIQTGVLPETHGIFDNDIQIPGNKYETWRFHVSNISPGVKTLPDEATKAGKTVCSILFPVTGGANIRYNFPEIPGYIPQVRRIYDTFAYGTASFVFSSLLRYGYQLGRFHTSDIDDFATSVACGMIRKRKADLIMLHLLDADDNKHVFGPHSKESSSSLERLDLRLGKLLRAIESSGQSDSMSVLLFSDHNCCDVAETIRPNRLLREAGFTYLDAHFHSSHGACFLTIKNEKKRPAILRFAEDFQERRGVARRLSEEEMHVSGADKEYDLGYAAAPGFGFGKKELGQHGFALDRENYYTFYAASGGPVAQGKLQEGGSLLNICPLAVDLLGLEPWKMDGKNELF